MENIRSEKNGQNDTEIIHHFKHKGNLMQFELWLVIRKFLRKHVGRYSFPSIEEANDPHAQIAHVEVVVYVEDYEAYDLASSSD